MNKEDMKNIMKKSLRKQFCRPALTCAVLFALMVGLCTGCVAQSAGYQSVDVASFEKGIADVNVVRLDVRTSAEYAAGHLPDAVNLDVMKEDFESRALKILPKDKTIAVYCKSGRRSKKAADLLTKNGYKVLELNTGFQGWTAAGNPVTREEVDLFLTSKGTCIYTYCIKHGSVKMRIGDRWVYVDPVTTAVPPATDYSNMPKADVILITHAHADHADSVAVRQLYKEGTTIIANAASQDLLGKKCAVMRNGDKKRISDDWSLLATAAYNTSADKQNFHPKGRDNGYLLTIDGFRIYIAGDTEDIPELANLKNVDVAFLPCNLPFTMTPEQLSKAARMLMPKVLFPYHYGQTDMQKVASLLEDAGMEVRIRQYQ